MMKLILIAVVFLSAEAQALAQPPVQERSSETAISLLQANNLRLERMETQIDELAQEQNRLLQELKLNRTWLG